MGQQGKRAAPDQDSPSLALSPGNLEILPSSSERFNRRSTVSYPPRSPRSPGLFSANVFRRTSYRRKDSDDLQEMVHLNESVASLASPSPVSPPPHQESHGPSTMAESIRLSIGGSLRRKPLAPQSPHNSNVSPISPLSTSSSLQNKRATSPISMKSPKWERFDAVPEHDPDDNTTNYPDRSDYTHLNTRDSDLSASPPLESHAPSNSFKQELPPPDRDHDTFSSKYAEPPRYCSSKRNIKVSRTSWLTLTIYALSVYSTVMSAIWLVVSILQPRWGHQISSRRGLEPASATLLAALAAKTIEISFVTVFVSCLGQVLSRRSSKKDSGGVTLAEMTMRNWVIQPGSLITHFESLPYAGSTLLGAVSLAATIAALLYTTASDAMVSPKLKYGSWEFKSLSGHVRTSYANVGYIQSSCTSIKHDAIDDRGTESCMGVQFSGQSYRNLLSFMTTWSMLNENNTQVSQDINQRPVGTMLLHDNTTMLSSWIETSFSNVTKQFEDNERLINNVSLSYPHPGVYTAALAPINDILQPDDLGGVGEYIINAAVVSPSINVLCVSMDAKDLAPLVYTAWPGSRNKKTNVGKQETGLDDWVKDVPPPVNKKGDDEFLNSTDVDDIFRWGKKYGRRPPVFQLYPNAYNMITNSTVVGSDSLYLLGKDNNTDNYSLCELRSWVSPNCMTQFNISGTGGAKMRPICEEEWDQSEFSAMRAGLEDKPFATATDWKWVSDAWRLSMDLNGGVYNNNASNSRILTQLGIQDPKLPSGKPSLAEALAVFAGSTVVIGAIDTSFDGEFRYTAKNNILEEPGPIEKFQAVMVTQQYTSGHINTWQRVFYLILGLVFGINLFCLLYLAISSGPVTDFTEPQNLFALAINSPPTTQIQGSCGGGPEDRDLVVPWRVSHAPSVNHYFFEEANDRPWRGKYSKDGSASGVQIQEGIAMPRPSVVLNKV